jgi:hypothetical protein
VSRIRGLVDLAGDPGGCIARRRRRRYRGCIDDDDNAARGHLGHGEAAKTSDTGHWRDRHGHHHSRELLPHDDPDTSLAFYRDTLGFEVRNDVGYGGMRWITVGPADQPGTSTSGLPVRL